MKKTSTFLFIFLLSLVFSYSQAQTTHLVAVSNNTFTPANLTIAAGDMVRWVLAQGVHSVTSDAGAWTEAILDSPGEEFTHTFTTAGSFPYHCRFHPGMNGNVTVTGTTAAPGLLSASSLLKVYPNPAQHQLSVSSASLVGVHQLNVWNTLGQLVMTENVNPTSEENWFLVNVAHLPAGSYLIMLQNADGLVAKTRFQKID